MKTSKQIEKMYQTPHYIVGVSKQVCLVEEVKPYGIVGSLTGAVGIPTEAIGKLTVTIGTPTRTEGMLREAVGIPTEAIGTLTGTIGIPTEGELIKLTLNISTN